MQVLRNKELFKYLLNTKTFRCFSESVEDHMKKTFYSEMEHYKVKFNRPSSTVIDSTLVYKYS